MTDRYQREAGYGLAEFKAADTAPDADKGEFEALVSVFGNVDLGGDIVKPGAFAKSLERWKASGDPIPVIWNHQWDNPLAHIGEVKEAWEADAGLVVRGTIDLDNEFSKQAHRLLAGRRVKEFSFGYNVVDGEQKDGAFELNEVDLIEVGPTLKGMNPATQLLAVKSFVAAEYKAGRALIQSMSDADKAAVVRSSELLYAQIDADAKAGARLSKDTRSSIQQAIDLLGSLIAADASSADEQSKSIEAEAPSGKASEDADDLLTRINLLRKTHNP